MSQSRLIVLVNGHLHALDALTGCHPWLNDLPGFGTGVASLASTHGGSSVLLPAFGAAEDAQRATMTQINPTR